MLKVYLNELRKVKRQKTVRMIMLVGVLMPTFSFALCLHNGALVNIFWTQNYKNYSVTA